MFLQRPGDLTIRSVRTPKRGTCLQASVGDREILIDHCGKDPTFVPDGTNAYLFGNKLILVTRWSDMSDAERDFVRECELCLVIHPYFFPQFSLKVDRNWGDVTVNLYHCAEGWNDESRPVDEAIFLFADTHDSDFVIARSVRLPQNAQDFLRQANIKCRETLQLDRELPELRLRAEHDPSRDLYDLVYDICRQKTVPHARAARRADPDNVLDGIYITNVPIDDTKQASTLRRTESDGRTAPTIDASRRSRQLDRSAPSDRSAEETSSNAADEAEMYRCLAKCGVVEAMYDLGCCYETGEGVAKDAAQAVSWYTKAADLGFAKAQYNLGVCCYNGAGTARDPERAVKLFLQAAQQGDMYAQYDLGVCCYNGDGTGKDILGAVEWFRKAAAQGHPEAIKILGGK